MRRRPLVLTASMAALVLAAITPTASYAAESATSRPAAATPAVMRYVALEGSGSHLLYVAKKTAKAYNGSSGTQYVLDEKGHRTTVPKGYRAYLVGDDPLFRRETRAVDGLTDVHWIRPDHHTSGVLTVPETSTIVAAAPDGWVIRTQIGGTDDRPVYRLRRVLTDGTKVDLGVPYPDGAPFTPEWTPSGLLAISEVGDGGERISDGRIEFMRWAAPGHYRTLYPLPGTKAVRGTAFSCYNSSSTLVMCNIEGDETVNRLFSLTGSAAPVSSTRCDGGDYFFGLPAVRTFAVAWIDSSSGSGCTKGRVEQVATNGKRIVSTRRYDTHREPVTAFGALVVGTTSQRHLVTIGSPSSTPRQIVGG